MLQTDVSLVLLESGLNGTAGLPNVDLCLDKAQLDYGSPLKEDPQFPSACEGRLGTQDSSSIDHNNANYNVIFAALHCDCEANYSTETHPPCACLTVSYYCSV
jgi:hypothetical protein